jgi:TonB family protein
MSFVDGARKLLLVSAALCALCVVSPRLLHAQKVYAAAELTTPVSVKSPPDAAATIDRYYPTALQRIGGKVQLEFVVQPDGTVDESTIKVMVATVSALGDAATRAVKQIRFNPGKVDGQPVRALVLFPVIYAAR